MLRDYKRIITISGLYGSARDLESWDGHRDLLIRPAKSDDPREWVIEAPMSQKKLADKLADMFDADEAAKEP